MAENSGDSLESRAVVGDSPTKNISQNKKIKVVFIFILIFILIIIAGIFYKHINNSNKLKKLTDSQSHLKSLTLAQDCSAQAQNSLAGLQANPKDINASIWLLNYRAYCLDKEQKYSQENTVLEQLKNYYSLKNDQNDLMNVDRTIDDNNYAIAHQANR